MTREIKYQFYDEESNTIYQLTENSDHTISFSKDGIMQVLYTFEGTDGEWVQEVRKGSIRQFTGLLDKNGKEIYEGDFVKILHHHTIGEVYFEETSLQFMIKNSRGGWEFVNGQRYEELPEYRSYEIIGNIYENPELLTK